ncbi:MAG: hypothetical protein M1461_01440 [Nitrospirae bacterium]|nr:hypothetical protein [Nitrospirota bacterium]
MKPHNIDYHSLSKASRALKAFSLLYLPFHNESIEFFFHHFGLFSFLEASVYLADETNEDNKARPLINQSLSLLRSFLRQQNLLDTQCKALLVNAKQYYDIEQRFIDGKYNYDKVLAANTYRSYDFRLLHRIMYQIKKRQYDEDVFNAFIPFEKMMELDDDRVSSIQDHEKRTFNIWNALMSISQDKLISYICDLRSAISKSENAMGKSYRSMLATYYQLVPASLLVDKTILCAGKTSVKISSASIKRG